MNYDELMQKLIDSTVPYIVDGSDEEKKEMSINLEISLRYAYKDNINDIIKFNDEKGLDFMIEKILERYNSKTLIDKKRELLHDEVLEKITNISNKAQKLAIKRCDEGIICEDKDLYDEYSKVLLEKDPKVAEYNKEIAVTLISEGLLDLNYAFGYSDAMSLRVGRWKH